MSIKAPSIKDIKAGFVHDPINTIEGKPTYKSIEHLQNQLICNAATLESKLGGGYNGLAGLVKFPQVYLLQTGHNVIWTPNPGEAPVFPPMLTNAQRNQIQMQFAIAKKKYDCCQCMDILLKNQAEVAMDPMWLSGIHSTMHGFGNRSIMDVIQYLFRTYGRISPDEITTNIQRLNQPADPAKPIQLVWK
eukprot:4609046-Ditylum_brightwellii.AAC.1